jgi:selenide, water dikinase
MEGVLELVGAGLVTGASGRNWASYGGEVRLGPALGDAERAVLADPQTSGGLLVACAAAAVEEVTRIFRRHGFDACADIGAVAERGPGGGPRLVVE